MRAAIVVLLLLIANAILAAEQAGDNAPSSAAVAAPETTAGQLLAEWLTASNAPRCIVVVLANVGPFAAQDAAAYIADRLL